jgi:hypothetical protein
MKKRLFAVCILTSGLVLIGYGVTTATVVNESMISERYECSRVTKDIRPTDKYCNNLSSAPEAIRDFSNTFVYAGAAVAMLGVLYIHITLNSKKK